MPTDDIAPISSSRALAEAQIPAGTGELDNVPWVVQELAEAERAFTFWKVRIEELKSLLRRVAGEHEELTLNGSVEWTYSRINNIRGADLKKEHPDIYQAYLDVVPTPVFNLELFAKAKPELFAQYQTRVLKKKA